MLGQFPIYANVAAADIARARAWYADKLGLVPELEDDGLWYRFADGTWLHTYETPFAGTAQNTQAGWSVTGIETVMGDLRGRGVVFEDYDFGNGMATVDGLLAFGTAKACWFKDSEGNTFELSEVVRS
jgi:catechol 2,3-dioxygenase-like lactoylglutathione lyase family enzyme